MSEISETIDLFLKENMNSLLKANGFKKTGRKYHREHGSIIEIINIESSTYNQLGKGTFWVCMSIYIPEVSEFLNRHIADKRPKWSGTGIFTMLGSLMPGKQAQDLWEVYVSEENNSEGKRFSSALKEYCLPWFEKMRDKQELIGFLEATNAFLTVAAIYQLEGENALAKKAIEEISNKLPNKAEIYRNWAVEHGIKMS